MATAFARALGQLFDPRILTLLGVCVVLSTGCFVAAWFGVDWLLAAGLGDYVSSSWLLGTLGGLLTRETPVRQLMGPVGIAQLSGSAAELGWVALLNLMAMISLNLGLLNLMPVPVLDGGHIAILAVEGVARRDLSVSMKERILVAGATVMVLLMVTVIYNDIARLIR